MCLGHNAFLKAIVGILRNDLCQNCQEAIICFDRNHRYLCRCNDLISWL
jgi:hypothetical protein